MSDDADDTPVDEQPQDDADVQEGAGDDAEANPEDTEQTEQAEERPESPKPDPYVFNEKSMSIWEKWQEGKKEADDIPALKESIASECEVSINQVDKIIKCGLYAGDRDEQGRRDGKGKAIFPNGDKYDGQYSHGMRQGEGKYEFAAGGSYTGSYYENLRSGTGILELPSGLRYEGEWQEDQFWGEGSIRYENGDTYEGTFRAGKRDGRGRYVSSSTGSEYVGEWVEGRREGQGKWQLTPAVWFEGTFEDNEPTGRGKFIFADGNEVEGVYSPAEVEQPLPIVTKVVKAEEEEAEEGTPRTARKFVRKLPPPRQPLERALRFEGDGWKGVHVYH